MIDFPEVVKAYAPYFKDQFSEAGFNHFQRFISGLLIGSNHTVEGINRLFALAPLNQSSANRFINCQNFSLDGLSRQRIELMQQSETTKIKEGGCLSIDGSLLHHVGTKFDGIANMWDHVSKTYGPAHELVSLYYADDDVDYPLHYQLWDPPDWVAVAEHIRRLGFPINEARWETRSTERQKWQNYMRSRYKNVEVKHEELQDTYRTKIHIAERLLRQYLKDYPDLKLPLAIDSGFSSNRFCRVVSEKFEMNYVADIRATQLIYRKGEKTASLKEFIEELRLSHRSVTEGNPKGKPTFNKISYHYRGEKKTVYAYCGVHRFKSYDKKQKVLIQFNNEQFKGDPRISITNRLSWYPSQILRIRRLRWPIETYHQEAKAQGLESYQVRNKEAIDSHIAFVIVAYTMLVKASRDEALLAQLRKRIQMETDGTLPFLRRVLKGGAMMTLAQYYYLAAQSGQSLEKAVKPIINAITYT